jgi:Fic family protein
VRRVRRLQELRETYRREIATQTRAAAVLQVVDLLFARPVITVKQVAQELSLSYAAANRHVTFLTAYGLLQEATGQARNRVYRAGAIIEAIDVPL